MDYVHLQLKTAYSLLKSTCSIEETVKEAAALGYQSLAITDENVMYGVIPFYKACLTHNIKPIIGMSTTIVSENGPFSLILLAENRIGYENLLKISSVIQTKSSGGLPISFVPRYAEGLIAITPGLEGEVEQLLLQGEEEKAQSAISFYQEIFPQFYFSLQNHHLPEQAVLNERLQGYDVPAVVTNNIHYIHRGDAPSQECLLSIAAGTKMSDANRPRLQTTEYYLKSKAEMGQLFPNDREALTRTAEIAALCQVTFDFGTTILPKYPTDGIEGTDLLKQLCLEGLAARYEEVTDVHRERLRYELEVIGTMGYCDYFLIVWDFMKYAREQNILTGPGRGSAAGSLVAYVLYITNVDPIKYGLLFERFLNPERITMPDIDIDFPHNKRDEVIRYVAKKYGEGHVAQIVTFGTLGAKAAIRDVSRVMGVSPRDIDNFSKQIPFKLGITLQQAYDTSIPFQHSVHANPQNEKIFEIARKIEGLPRHTSTHAAGVVMSDVPLVEHVPLQVGDGDMYLTQFSGDILESLGLLKMDFLGLRNLTLIERICQTIQHRQQKTIDVNALTFDDLETYQLIGSGDTTGVFQLESSGMKKVLISLKPTEFEDIVAVNALYRPGPMEQIPTFIDSKHKKRKVTYIHPDLQPILESTYGVIVYQEQIMQIASKLAGFTMGEADLLRRAMNKKDRAVLDSERNHFVSGSVKNGYSEEIANDVYDLIMKFANYGFNRSHAVAYSMVAYQLAYLKTHSPLEFLMHLLTSYIGTERKIAQTIGEMKRRNIPILPPSVNKSQGVFTIEGDAIRYGLSGLKGVHRPVVQAIVANRKKRPYKDLVDLCLRVVMDKETVTQLILAGALDEFHENRKVLLASLDATLAYVEIARPENTEQLDLFHEDPLIPPPVYQEAEEMSQLEQLEGEREVLGFYLSGHPTIPFEHVAKQLHTTPLHAAQGTTKAVIYASRIKTIRTKKGAEMAFVTLSDETMEMDGVLFPADYDKFLPILKNGHVYYVEGAVEIRQSKKQLVLKNVKPIHQMEEYVAFLNKSLYVRIGSNDSKVQAEMKRILQKFSGAVPVYVYFEQERKLVELPKKLHVHPNENCLFELRKLLGEGNVVLREG